MSRNRFVKDKSELLLIYRIYVKARRDFVLYLQFEVMKEAGELTVFGCLLLVNLLAYVYEMFGGLFLPAIRVNYQIYVT
jgi:hypothetical protein